MVWGSHSRASAVAEAVHPWSKSHRAYPVPAPGSVAAGIVRRRKTLASICHCWRNRPISLTPITNSSLIPGQANPFPPQFTPCFCAFHLGLSLEGMTRALKCLSEQAHPALPVTIYYAFKQSERTGESGIVSTGWETFLDAVIQAGFAVTGTWPVRTELGNRLVGMDTNALASSIVLVCRPPGVDVAMATRREFLDALRSELPEALRKMQQGNIAPVDLAQAAIGPGMAIFTRYARVLDASGAAVSVREALALINETLDEVLAEQEGDFDADTRWALAWFDQSGFSDGEYGVAETLSTAKNTSVAGMVEAGILTSGAGKVRLLAPAELPQDWGPEGRLAPDGMGDHTSLGAGPLPGGDSAAADIMANLGADAETARDLAYRLYRICDLRNRPQEALGYNALVRSWGEISGLATQAQQAPTEPNMFDGE